MAEIELINVHKSWGNFNAVVDFNLIIKDQEFLVLLGPSGCGKTTTMRMIAGLEDLSEGVIKIGSKIVNDLEPKDRDVSMVFQSYGLYPNMTVYENVRFPLKISFWQPHISFTVFLCKVSSQATLERIRNKTIKIENVRNTVRLATFLIFHLFRNFAPKWLVEPLYKGKP